MIDFLRKIFCVAALAGILLGSAGGVAQTVGMPPVSGEQCLAFDDSLMLAASRAPEVAGAWARRDEAIADLRTAESLRHPQLSTFARSGVGDSGLTTSQIDNQIGLRLSQRVMDFGDARLARQSALATLDRRGFDIRDQQMTAATTVAMAYLDRLEADAMVAVISERRAYFERQQNAVRALLARGGATRAEQAQIAAQLAEAEADMLELIFQAERATIRIVEYTGLEQDICGPADIDTTMSNLLRGLDTIDDVIDHALHHNPLVGARRSSIDSLEARRERERRSRLPVVDVVGVVSYSYDDLREDWEYRDRVGVDVSIPLLSGNSIGAGRDRVAAQLSQEENGLRSLQRTLREEVEITFRRAISLQAQLIRREAVADSQREYFEAIAGEFEFGLGTLPELVVARLTYEQAMLDVVTAQFSLLRQKLSLMRLTARIPLPERSRN